MSAPVVGGLIEAAKRLGDEPAHPVECVFTDDGQPIHGVQTNNSSGYATGLTKREMFAAMAMQGILANRTYEPLRRNRLEGMASDAVTSADMLLAALAAQPGGSE